MADRVAVIKGTFLRPGVSKNNRLYTKENISDAVHRMKGQLQREGSLPLTMFTSHMAAFGDDALNSIGRITNVSLENDGSASFMADIADTAKGRDVAALVTPTNPYVKGVSLRGSWAEEETIEHEGRQVKVGKDFQVKGIDLTSRPSVDGAQINFAAVAEAAATAGEFFESFEEDVFVDVAEEELSEDEICEAYAKAVREHIFEDGICTTCSPGYVISEADKTPYGNVTYADPGYQKDKVKRYPLDSEGHVRAAWSYINMPKNAGKYSPAQVARIKSRIKTAAGKYNIKINAESEAIASRITEMSKEISEVLEAYGINQKNLAEAVAADAFFSKIEATVPPTSNNDDGDYDGLGNVADCAVCGAEAPSGAMYCPTCGQPIAQAESTPATQDTKEAPVAEDTSTTVEGGDGTATAPAPARNLTEADISALAAALKDSLQPATATATVTAPEATPAVTTPPATTESATTAPPATVTFDEAMEIAKKATEAAVKEAVDAVRAEAIETLRHNPTGMGRRGLMSDRSITATQEGELETDSKKLSELSESDFGKVAVETWMTVPPFNVLPRF